MKKIKLLSSLALFGASALVLASCGGDKQTTTTTTTNGGSTTTNGSSTTTTTTGGTVTNKTINFYHTAGQTLQGQIDLAIASFQEKYPGWKVVQTNQGGYDELYASMITYLTAGTQPDLAFCYADHVATYITSGKVVDMAQFINSTETVSGTTLGYTEEEKNDFVKGFFEEGYATNYADYDKNGFTADSMLTLPFSKSTEIMYYNRDAIIECAHLLVEKGVISTVDEAQTWVPTTWDELWAAAEAIKTGYPVSTPVAYDSEANWIINMAMQNGWNYTSPQSPYYTFRNDTNMAAWLDTLSEKYDAGLLTTKTTYGGYTSDLFTQLPEQGGAIFCIGSSGGASYQYTENFEWGVAPIPGSKDEDGNINKSVISQGPSLVMFNTAGVEKQKMTFLFIKELLDPAFQSGYSQASGYNPVRLSTYELDSFKAFLATNSIQAQVIGIGQEISDWFFTSPAFNGSTTARLQIGNAVVYCVKGEKSGADALENAYKACGGR